jgi:hypothetical protein
VLSFYFRDEVLPYYAGDDPAARDLAANDFKYWEAYASRLRTRPQGVSITGAASAGTGSYAFKTNWGFEPQPLHYEYLPLQARRGAAEQPGQPALPAA